MEPPHYIVLVPQRTRWPAFAWRPCRARLPMMVQYECGGDWFRDGFDPEHPRDPETGTIDVGIVLCFDRKVERTTWGVVFGLLRFEDVAAHHLAAMVLEPSWEDMLDAAKRMRAEGFVSEVWTGRPVALLER
jgi:hypothetical protein